MVDDFLNPFIVCHNENLVNGLVLVEGKNPFGKEVYIDIYEKGILHSLLGPSIIYSDGSLEYRINGKFIGVNLSNKEFKNKIKKMIFE